MKTTFLTTFLVSSFSVVNAGSFDGVQLNCLERAEAVMAKEKRMSLVAVCRDRKNPAKEHYTFSDGSGLTGFTTFTKAKQCLIQDWWHGQDDQDQIDEAEWKAECLTEEDFKRTSAKVTVSGPKPVTGINTAYSYYLKDAERLTSKEVAEHLAKKIRQERYQARYSIESHTFAPITINKALIELSQMNGEARALKKAELENLNSWIENHSVSHAFIFTMYLEQMGGSGIEQVIIFVSSEKYEPVLVVFRDVYAE